MEGIIIAIITGVLSVVSVIITNATSNKKVQNDMKIQSAVVETEIKELTREVRRHNNFAERIPVLEEKIKVLNNRVKDLENYNKGD